MMRGPRFLILVGCSIAMVFASSAAKAGGAMVEGGTITFVGSIVEPTCNVATNPNVLNAVSGEAAMTPSSLQTCSVRAGVETSPPQVYAVTVAQLSGSESDRVLQYFDNYVRAEQPGAKDPVLVTQTYE